MEPWPGRNLEDLGELEYQRSAPQPLLLSSVLHENLEDLRHSPADPEEQECQGNCSVVGCCREEKDTIVGTSANCSAFCGGRRSTKNACGIGSREILGTATTCSTSAGAPISRKRSTTRSPNCGTGTSSVCTHGNMSTMCTAVCRCTPGNGRTSTEGVGRVASTSPSSNKLKYCVLAALGEEESSGSWRLFNSLPSSLALAVLPCGRYGCVASAKAMATLIRAYRKYAWRRRYLRRLAAPVAWSTPAMASTAEAILA